MLKEISRSNNLSEMQGHGMLPALQDSVDGCISIPGVNTSKVVQQWFKYYKTMSFSSWFYDIGTIV